MSRAERELVYTKTIHEVKQYIHEHLDQPLHREKLASVAGFSVQHLHRIFIASMGITMSDYIRELRL